MFRARRRRGPLSSRPLRLASPNPARAGSRTAIHRRPPLTARAPPAMLIRHASPARHHPRRHGRAARARARRRVATAARRPPAQTLQPLLDAEVAAGAPGVSAYLDDGRRVWQGAAGVADARTGRRLRPDDRFRAGSNTKSMVSTVVLQLVGEGRLSLGDTVAGPLGPILPYAGAATDRNLLNHTR